MVLGAAIVALVVVLAMGVGAVAAGLAAYGGAVNAADAAALAAAPVTFRPFGADGTATDEARRYARHNGARLVACQCGTDPSWRSRTVSVTVERTVRILGLGVIPIRATSRATFTPLDLLPVP